LLEKNTLPPCHSELFIEDLMLTWDCDWERGYALILWAVFKVTNN